MFVGGEVCFIVDLIIYDVYVWMMIFVGIKLLDGMIGKGGINDEEIN